MREGRTAGLVRSSAVTIVLFLLSVGSFAPVAHAQGTPSTPSPYGDHGFAALASNDRITLGYLMNATGGSTSVSSFEKVIQNSLIPLGVREVLLDIGWQDFTVGAPKYEQWVDNWLTASDAMGISNVFYVGQLTSSGFGSPWVDSLIRIDPSVATYYSNGTRAPFVSLDNPDVALYLERDLGMLYSYYGSHTSWVGLGTGSSQKSPLYSNGSSVPTIGYSNLTISSFANSPNFNADVNSSGYLPNGMLDAIWSEYRAVQPGIVLSSGLWMTSTPYQVYGNGSSSSYVEMRFEIPASATALQLEWFGSKTGNPGNLNVVIYPDSSGGPLSTDKVATASVLASSFSNSTGWQQGVQLTGNFSAGWYWVTFSSPSSDSSNGYTVYLKDYLINNATGLAAQASIGPGFQHGSTILWVKNQTGQDLAIYPFQQTGVGAPDQVITATHVYSFNTIFLFLSDRAFNTANATLTVTDTTTGRTVATAVLSQKVDQGLENWVPIPLNDTVTTVTGDRYLITVSDPSVTWTTVMRYLVTDPPQAGFQDQKQTLLFELGNLDWSQGVKGFGGMTSNGNDAVTTGYMDAMRFIPSTNETLSSVHIMMFTPQPSGVNYSSGTITVAIWGSAPSGSQPQGPPLQEVTIPAKSVPQNGFLNATGLNLPLNGGQDYWVVFSANSSQRFSLARLTSPYQFLVLASGNGGKSWYSPAEGPTEYAITLTLSNETLGTFVAGAASTALTTSSIFAQSFVATSNSAMEGVYFGPLTPGPDLLVSVNPTGANGEPSANALASGIYHAGNITLDYGPEFAQFSSVANLQKGQVYWIVIRPLSGEYNIPSLLYLKSAPQVPPGSNDIFSNDNGISWNRVSNYTALISEYLLETPPTPTPQYNTETLYSDLVANHNYSVTSGPLKGWNAYLQASQLSTFNSVAKWLSSTAGRQFRFYANASPNIAGQLNPGNVVVLPTVDSNSSCSSFSSEVKSSIASGAARYAFAPISLLEQCSGSGLAGTAQQLNFAPFFGGAFGSTTTNRVLVVGDHPQQLGGYLSNAFNVSTLDLSTGQTLHALGNLSSYDAILWSGTGGGNVSAADAQLLSRYVSLGGELVTTDPALENISSPLAAATGGAPGAQPPGTPFLDMAVAHTSYANESFQVSESDIGLTATSPGLTISARILGSGRVVFIGFANASTAQVSSDTVVIANALAGAFGVQSPFWYSGSSVSPSTIYSVHGSKSGRLLVWVYNPSSAATLFALDLNGSYFGLASTWSAVQIPGLTVEPGSGQDVGVRVLVPEGGLIAVIIGSRVSPQISYSSAPVVSQYSYPDQSLYSIIGAYNQSVLAVVSTNRTASSVLLDDNTSLPQQASASAVYGAASGWYFNQTTGSLIVKFQSSGVDTLRYMFYAPPAPPPAALPVQTLTVILVAAIVAEGIVIGLLAVRRLRRTRSIGKPGA